MSAVELSLTDIMDKLVVDDWGQCRSGPFGSLRAHVEAGLLSEETLYAELGEIVAGRKPGRESDAETILFWHRGCRLSESRSGTRCSGRRHASGSASACGTLEGAGTLGARPWVRTINSAPVPPPEYGFTSSARSPWPSTTVPYRKGAGGCARPRRSSSCSRSPRATACIASR